MVYVIKYTVDIYCLCKNLSETAQEHLLFKLPPVSLKQIEKFLQYCRKFLLFKIPDSRAKKVGRKPTPSGSENVRIPGGRPEGVGGWSGLELTDTLIVFQLSLLFVCSVNQNR